MKLLYILLACATISSASVLSAMDDACTNNVAEACYEIGAIYLGDDGIPTDLEKSKGYLTKACNLNFDKACSLLEKMNINYKEEK